MPKTAFAGLVVPVITPFSADLEPDADAFVRICRHMLDEGAHGLAPFGTTSEATSLSLAERTTLLERLVDSGIDPACLLPGVGLPSLPETVALTRHAVSLGCGGVLMLPPFYYKPVETDGLEAFYLEVIDRVGSDDLGLWLYHIPQMAGVGIPLDLIERLVRRHPSTVIGIKDSSGDYDNTCAILERFPGFRVFPSSEGVLLDATRRGAVGCITASGNVNPAGIRRLYDALGEPEAEALQRGVAEIRAIVSSFPLIPAVKRAVAERLGEPGIARPRPPLRPLGDAQAADLMSRLDAAGLAPAGAAR
ncbi:dihydrodipicolinate synthase family protein [Salinarimonas ramus]|uniref:Dihydrodipicolinate synthase family protein n=1 Tax=Salinarimonas ramus TaxID=690164 RepID=A0A917QG99_9HYPH|nr:dihydrodipicolinate synthase family protein [Salinarimonas ramus]GGK49118.1 dihydrodipicolinate synthase family protein [Salinarimonas ramus]